MSTTTTTTTTKREYKLAADPIVTNYGAARREILQFTDGHREVIAVVSNDDAMDVLDALRRAYQDGREDRGGEDEPVTTKEANHG